MKKLRLGVIGLSGRGFSMMKGCISFVDSIEMTAVCDLYQDRVERAAEFLREKNGKEPFCTQDYRELLKRDDVDAIYIATAWESHIEISIAALRAGKAVGCEVGGAYSINDCYELVKAYEETGTPFMLMENCCYDKQELLATAMARAGKFGTLVHAEGAYAHDLRGEISNGNIKRHYRLRNYTNRNCDNYPTHDLGPIAKVLNINRGNQFLSLVSMSSKACGLEEYIEENKLYENDPTLKGRKFAQGDVVTTVIKCQNGETIILSLDTTLPRLYDRKFTLRGTKGMYSMTTQSVFLDGMNESAPDPRSAASNFEEEFLHPLWKNITPEQIERGHGGMDGFMFNAFADAILNGKEMPIDVYDAASWMCISCLSEQSIAKGGAPVAISDFTNGKWLLREPKDVLDLPKGNG